MSQSKLVTLIYMTPDLEQFEGGETVEPFEDLDDLMRRAQLPDLQSLLMESIRHYLIYLDTKGTPTVLVARPYDNPTGSIIDDEITDDYRQADIKHLHMITGTLDSICEKAGIETVDELLMRSLALYEKVVRARERGMGIGLYNPSAGEMEWLFDSSVAQHQPCVAHPLRREKLVLH